MHALLPGIAWPVAFAIGAVVAPPDAVAATAIARRIGLPRRIVTILEGESLLNDATALVALRTALAAMSVGVEAFHVGVDFLVASVGGAARRLRGRSSWSPSCASRSPTRCSTPAISFVVPFGAYIAAEEIHASGVIAVVVAGLLLGHKAPIMQTAQSRIAERMNWRTIAFVLENTVFLLIGLQAGWIIDDVSESTLSGARIAAVCAAVAGRLHRAADGLGVPGALPAGPARARPRHRPDAAVDVHVHPRLGRDARRGHAGRGVRDPGGHRRTARCCC